MVADAEATADEEESVHALDNALEEAVVINSELNEGATLESDSGIHSEDEKSDSAAGLEHTSKRVDKELDRIRERRLGETRRFPKDIADYVLISGLIIGLIYWGLIFVTTTGIFMADSIGPDQTLSGTILDPGEKCVDNSESIWVNIWVDEEQRIRISSHNINDTTKAALLVKLFPESGGEAIATEAVITSGSPSMAMHIAHRPSGEPDIPDGKYNLLIELLNVTDLNTSVVNLTNSSDPVQSSLSGRGLIADIEAEAKVSTRTLGSLFSSGAAEKEVDVEDDGARSCWTVQDLGGWGIVMMVAEWGGGRETAMLAGGSAGVPPWWMATVSLMMSVFFLFVQYPLMYRFYHRETDDILSKEQLGGLIERTLVGTAEKLHLRIEIPELRHQGREISIDVYVPYNITHRSYSTPPEIKTAFIRDILNEFAIFGEMRPLQLKSHAMNPHGGAADLLSTGIDGADSPEISQDNPMLVDDYTSFFEDLNTFARIEDAATDCLKQYFESENIKRRPGTSVMSDDHAVFIRVIYRPSQRFAFIRFKKTHFEVEDEIEKYVSMNLKELLMERSVVVSASNEVQTFADRAAAGRVESSLKKDVEKSGSQEAYVAKQAGIAGTLLQNQFVGDIISSIEYVAHENRSRIDRWGFFGLIIFVWIPFMASGVLVGAMLGLVARMKFERVLAACLIGGTAASITWAYTAKGIIEFMERYHAEAFIPVIITIIVVVAFLHVRTNKRRRKEALFRESMTFFRGPELTKTSDD